MRLADDPLVTFAKSRGLPVTFLREHGLSVCPEDGERPGWISIPYPHMTGIWYERYRNPGDGTPKYLSPSGAETHLYNPLRLGPNTDEIVFTEGEVDCLTAVYLGFPAVGVPGTGLVGRFHASWRLLFEGCRVVIAFDGDEAGRAAAAKLFDLFEPSAKVVDLPDDTDLNEWYLEDGTVVWNALAEALGRTKAAFGDA